MTRWTWIFAAILIFAGTFFTQAPIAEAKHGDARPPRHGAYWTCYAQGRRSYGYPMGDIWQTTMASAPSQNEAAWRALDSCHSWGLYTCMIQHCFRR